MLQTLNFLSSVAPHFVIAQSYSERIHSYVHNILRIIPTHATNMTRFRPCIDLHAGQVKQIVGGTLDSTTTELKTNFVSSHGAAYFAKLYRDNDLTGAHVIMLGPGNTEAAREALAAWPGGLQVGGGITDANAKEWIEAGAEKVRPSSSSWSYMLSVERQLSQGLGFVSS